MEYALWGKHNSHMHREALKVSAGTLRQCRGAMRRREREGWYGMVILPPGHPYNVSDFDRAYPSSSPQVRAAELRMLGDMEGGAK